MSSKQEWPEGLSRFVSHFSTRTEKSSLPETPADFIRVIDSDMGRSVDFNRIAVHHITLPPGCRTSSPHAESAEEEFVFVLKGKPDLWLNGFIHALEEGFAVGFPAGTGIAHTVINNTSDDVHLLVAGDKTKSENLCSFPINPELKETCPIWWDHAPIHQLGPHGGLPGPIKESEKAKRPSSDIVDCFSQKPKEPFHYPGDNETFGEGVRLTDLIGLKNLGIWFERLPPGRRSSFPHAHTHEEEFVFLLKGRLTVWLDGFTKVIAPGSFAAFPSNTGFAHTLINNTDDEVIYLCVGETQDFHDEKIIYPLNPLRQSECRRKGWYWDDLTRPITGSHSAQPAQPRKEHIRFQICSDLDSEMVLNVFQSSPRYFERVEGCLPTLQMAKHAMIDQPKTRCDHYFKESLIILLNDQPIGFLDLHANHPEKETCYLGLLLISENLVFKGLGRKCYRLAEDYIKRALLCKKIRLGVSHEHDVAGFWQKMGFEFTGKTYEWQGEQKTTMVREFEKQIASSAVD